MEVTPELYAWLTSMNIIDCVKSLRASDNAFEVPERTLAAMSGGKYIDRILCSLEESYNKFYKLKLNYTANLVNLKPIDENDDYISNSIKYYNWNLIAESLSHFGLNYTEEDILKITSGDKQALIDVIMKIFTLSNELLKRSNDADNTAVNNNTSKLDNTIITSNDNNKTLSNNPKTTAPTAAQESINVNTLNPKKNYESCSSLLELFIISLCKNFELKPRQAVALLSNNRKYLSLLCNKGIKGDFSKVTNWLSDIHMNLKLITKMIRLSPSTITVSLATIGSALCSKNSTISLSSAEIMSTIQMEFGFDWSWLTDEGIDAFLFAIIKHDDIRLNLLNILYDFVRNRLSDFMLELKKRASDVNSLPTIMNFLSCSLSLMNQLNKKFYNELRAFVLDICLNNAIDKSYAISIIADALYYFNDDIGSEVKNAIIGYLKTSARVGMSSQSLTAIAKMFHLVIRFGDYKNTNAPPLYKMLVFLLLENFDDETKRECFLLNFEKFFISHPMVPIDILFEPYFKQLKNCSNYALCDLIFIFKMIEHPRLSSYNIIDIIEFVLSVTMHNLIYARTANLILTLIFEKKLILSKCDDETINEIYKVFIDYIKSVISIYISNLSKIEDKAILETAYDILGENINDVNSAVEKDIIEAIRSYRKVKGENSNCLLAMLWGYEDNDAILLQIEEEFAPQYEPVEVMMEKEKMRKEEMDKRDYLKKAQNLIATLNTKKKIIEKENEKKEIMKIERDKKIKNSLVKKRQRKSIMLGIGVEDQLKQLQFKNVNALTTTAAISPMLMNSQTESTINNIMKTSSSMYDAIAKAKDNFDKKNNAALLTSASVPKRNFQLKPIKKSSSTAVKDDILERYGPIISIDKQKEIERYAEMMKEKEKLISSQQLILPEKTIIKDGKKGNMSNASNKARSNYITSEVYKNFILPINLEEEEDRETKAINGYNSQYSKNMKLYFRTYSNEVTNTISKANLLKMLREKGYNKYEINLEELTIAVRNLFGDNLNNLTYEQFSSLLVQLAFLIYTKKRDTLTISECYGNLLRHFMPNSLTEATINLNKRLKPVVDLIKQKLTNPKDENDSYFNMPPGFKILNKTSVVYNCRLAPHFVDIIGESKFVCYELIEEILFNILNSSTLEPYVKVNKYSDIMIEPGTVKNWSNAIMMTYVKMDDEYEKIGIDVCDALESGLRSMCRGKDKNGNEIIAPLIKYEIEEGRKYMESEHAKDEKRMKRANALKKKVEEYRKMKEEKRKKRLREENERRKQIRKQIEKEQEETKVRVEEVKERKNKLEEEKKNKLLERQEKQKEENEKKFQERKKFFNQQQRRLKEQFTKIKHQREVIQKQNNDPLNNLPEANAKYLKKDKDYIEFEKKLNTLMRNLVSRPDIKTVITKYEQHLHLIYDIYSKIGYNKISFFSNESIHLNEFKQFLINFTVLGLLISSEQMSYIFMKIASESRGTKDEQLYLTYDEFVLSLVYLSIYSMFANKERKILPSDVDNANAMMIENFFIFLGLKMPFNKNGLEMFINERRAMTMKSLLKLQREIKKEKIKEYKQMQFEKEIQKQREIKKIEAIDAHEQKASSRDEEESKRDINESKEEEHNESKVFEQKNEKDVMNATNKSKEMNNTLKSKPSKEMNNTLKSNTKEMNATQKSKISSKGKETPQQGKTLSKVSSKENMNSTQKSKQSAMNATQKTNSKASKPSTSSKQSKK